jgi:hypothetical protein
MKFHWSVLCLALLTASCGDFPRDPEGTLARVRSQGVFRVGLVTIAPEGADGSQVAALLAGIGKSAGARAELIRGDAEPMLDLVIGRFEKKSPWAKLVTIGPPLRRDMQGKTEFRLAPVLRNGENAWVALVEREVRNAAPEAQ